MPQVRRIRPDERDRALATVVTAFRADPQVRWWFPDDRSYPELAALFFGVLLDTRTAGGEVWVADDCRAVAMWIPPGGNLIGPELASARYAETVAALPRSSRDRIAAVDAAVDALLPRSPHWYLGVLATDPAHRARGLASAVVAPVLAAADRAGMPVALETASPANVAFYTRRGFAVVHETEVADPAVAAGERDGAEDGDGDGDGDGEGNGLKLSVMRRAPCLLEGIA